MARRSLSAAVIALLSVALVVSAPDAGARRAATVALSAVHSQLDAGQAPQFRYSAYHLPADAVVQLQRELGTVWTTIKTVPKGVDQTTTAGPLPNVGRYYYRMQAVRGSTVLARTAHVQTIYVYDDFNILALCPHTQGTRACAKNNTNVGGTVVTTYMAIGSAVYPNYFAGANFARTSCRTADLIFTNAHNSTARTYLKLYQAGRPDQVGVAGHSQKGTLHASLVSGQLYFDGSTEGSSYSTLIGGTMSCFTSTGAY